MDIQIPRLVDECNFPSEDMTDFIKRDILINVINYYEVKKWAVQQKETEADADKDLPHVKLNMGAEANILPVRAYSRMFEDRLLPDGTPDPNYLQSRTLGF